MIKNNKVCILCGERYSFCSRCEEFDHLPRWMAIYCSDNCKKIFDAISAYNMKLKTKEEAAKILRECDLSRKSEFKESCQKYIDEILDIKKESSKEPVVVNTILEVENSAEVITEPQNKPKRIRNVKRK